MCGSCWCAIVPQNSVGLLLHIPVCMAHRPPPVLHRPLSRCRQLHAALHLCTVWVQPQAALVGRQCRPRVAQAQLRRTQPRPATSPASLEGVGVGSALFLIVYRSSRASFGKLLLSAATLTTQRICRQPLPKPLLHTQASSRPPVGVELGAAHRVVKRLLVPPHLQVAQRPQVVGQPALRRLLCLSSQQALCRTPVAQLHGPRGADQPVGAASGGGDGGALQEKMRSRTVRLVGRASGQLEDHQQQRWKEHTGGVFSLPTTHRHVCMLLQLLPHCRHAC